MYRVLLLNHVNTYFTGLLPLALMLKNSGEFDPVLLFSRNYPTVLDDLETCKRHSLEVCLIGELNHLAPADKNRDLNVIQNDEQGNFFKKIWSSSPLIAALSKKLFGGNLIEEKNKLSTQILFLRNLISKNKIDLLILPADNRYDFSLYVRAAHQENVGSVVVPQFMAGHLEWAEYVKNQPIYHIRSLINRLVAAWFPRWALNYKGHKLLALPGLQILALESLKISPPSPWVLHSGRANAIAIESEAIQDYCLKEGLDLEKLHITGSITHDHLFATQSNIEDQKSQLYKSLKLDEDLPIILSALPCDMIYTGRPECDFQIYEELVEFWCQTISSIKGYNHVVALHPSVRYEDMKYIEKFGLKVSSEPTSNLIPLCDIYVACVSSTIQWAIACAKPVLNYDLYRYRYTDYQKVPGVITVEEKEEFIQILNKLALDVNYHKKIASAQFETSQRWGSLDGQAGHRLRNLFSTTINKYKETM